MLTRVDGLSSFYVETKDIIVCWYGRFFSPPRMTSEELSIIRKELRIEHERLSITIKAKGFMTNNTRMHHCTLLGDK